MVANFKNRGVRQSVVPEAFVPYTVSGLGGFSVLLRTSGLPGTLAKTLESAALTLDGSTVVRRLRTMEEGLENEEYAKPRFGLQIFSVFALLGLLLVSMGLYSIMSYTVSQQRREMGIRLALGASPQNVQAMVIAMGLRLVVLGILVGWLVSFLALRTLQSQIWDLQAQDPITLGAVAGILVFVGIVACYVPSRVAFQVDPALTLRSE